MININRSNIAEWVEKYLNDELNHEVINSIQLQLKNDSDLKHEWDNQVDFINKLKNTASFYKLKGQIQSIQQPAKKDFFANVVSKIQSLDKRSVFRYAGVAATVGIFSSWGTYLLTDNNDNSAAQNQYISLKREVENIKTNQNTLKSTLAATASKEVIDVPKYDGDVIGTGFAISNNGYVATDYHVVENSDSIYLQSNKGAYHKAYLVAFDEKSDIALLKIVDEDFKFNKSELPYNIYNKEIGLSQSIYSIGYPQDDALYSEGYISSLTKLDTASSVYQLSMPANPGQSGSPIFDKNGNVIGMLIGKKKYATYATKSTQLVEFINTLPREHKIKYANISSLKGLSRQDQVNKVLDYIYSVRVYK